MLNLLLCASSIADSEFAKCFATSSTLEGDSQQMILTLILQPNSGTSANCLNPNNTEASAKVTFAKGISSLGQQFETTFTYYFGVVNRAVIDLKPYNFDITTFMEMTYVYNAIYEVKLKELNPISGTINQITHVKQDVSSCWKNIHFRYGILPGEEYVGFTFTPNMCQIPDDVLNDIKLILRITDLTTDANILYELDFQTSTEDGGFKLPYSHYDTLTPLYYCADYDNDDYKKACTGFIYTLITTVDWTSLVVLSYNYMDIQTEIIGHVNSYEMFDSDKCSSAAGLAVITYTAYTLISHASFANIPQCNKYMQATDHVAMLMRFAGTTTSAVIQMNYTKDFFYNQLNFPISNDNSVLFTESTYIYCQYVFLDSANAVVGGYQFYLNDDRSCIRLVSLKISKDKIKIEIWMEGNPSCTGQQHYDWTVDLIDSNQASFQTFPPVSQSLDRTAALNQFMIYCKNTADPKLCEKNLKRAKKLSLKGQMTFYLQSTSRYIGTRVYVDDTPLGLTVSFVLVGLYLVAGVIVVGVTLRNKHGKDDF